MIGYYSGAIQVLGPSLWLKLISLAPLYLMGVSLTALSVWQFDITSLVLHVKTWWWAKQKLLQKLCKKIFAEQHGMVGGLEAVMGAPSQFHRLRLTKRFSIVNIVFYLLMNLSSRELVPNQTLLDSQYSISIFRWWQLSPGKLLLERAKNRISSQRFQKSSQCIGEVLLIPTTFPHLEKQSSVTK